VPSRKICPLNCYHGANGENRSAMLVASTVDSGLDYDPFDGIVVVAAEVGISSLKVSTCIKTLNNTNANKMIPLPLIAVLSYISPFLCFFYSSPLFSFPSIAFDIHGPIGYSLYLSQPSGISYSSSLALATAPRPRLALARPPCTRLDSGRIR
jgi:hypothetical protein